MNLEEKLNRLLRERPFEFQYSEKVEAVKVNRHENTLVIFKRLNSKRRHSYPFYKPISKLLSPR